MSAVEPPNHHANFPGFSGWFGVVAGLSMVKRNGIARRAADLTGITASDKVIDVGCGPGTAVREAARRGATATGIDPAPVMLRIARLTTLPSTRIRWRKGAAEALPLPDGSANVLWSISTVHHWPDLEGGLSECFRVLEPGGRFLAIERRRKPGSTGMASHGWTDEQAQGFADMCMAAGFSAPEVRIETIGEQHHLIVLAAR
ncbi:MAG TPA: class I SAM-dependent methyltransferase [Pseudomonadales bacterium]|nr:class I SAM-dependent methyltransferase [Pseudomonadales bacterium]